MFTSSKKHEIRRFHVVVVQQRQRNVQKKRDHVQGCCFANLTLLLFSCSHCRRRRRHCISCLCLDDRSTLGTKITCFPWSLGTRSVFTTFETRWRLAELNFAMTSGTGKKLPIAERHAPRNDARNLPETIVGHFRF